MQERDAHFFLKTCSAEINELSISERWSTASKLVDSFVDTGGLKRREYFSDDLEKSLLYLIENAPNESKEKRHALYCLGSYAAAGCVKNYTLEEALELMTEAAMLGEIGAIQFLAKTYLGLKNEYFKEIGFTPINSEELALKYGIIAFKRENEQALFNLFHALMKGTYGLKRNSKSYRHIFYTLVFDLKIEFDEQRLYEAMSMLLGCLQDKYFEPSFLPIVYIILKRWQQSDLWNDTSDKNEELLKTVFTVHAENVDNPRLIILNRIFHVLDEAKLYELLKRPKSYQPSFHELNLFFGQFILEVKDLLSRIDQPHEVFTDYFKQWHSSSCFDINQPIDDLENTLLHLAIRKNNELFLKYLLMCGADVNCQNTFGQTALLISCENQAVNFVRILLENQANTEIGDEVGFYPMHFACLQGHSEIFHLLLEAKANCDPVSSYTGATPLLLAVKNNKIEIVKQLLQQGANLDIENKRGLGLLYFAMRQSRELTGWLLALGIMIPEDCKEGSASGEFVNEIEGVLKMRERKSLVAALRYYNEDEFPTLKQLVGFSIFKNPKLKKLATEKRLGKDLSNYIEQYLPRNLTFLEENNSQLPMTSSSSIP